MYRIPRLSSRDWDLVVWESMCARTHTHTEILGDARDKGR